MPGRRRLRLCVHVIAVGDEEKHERLILALERNLQGRAEAAWLLDGCELHRPASLDPALDVIEPAVEAEPVELLQLGRIRGEPRGGAWSPRVGIASRIDERSRHVESAAPRHSAGLRLVWKHATKTTVSPRTR